jgi:hypothetical protein
MWIDLSGRACGLRDSRAASVSDLRPVPEPVRRVFHPRAARADETSAGRLNGSRREPGIISEAGATTRLEGPQRLGLAQQNRERDHGARCLIACKGWGMAFVSKQRVLDLDKFQMANDIESLRVECKWERKMESVHAGDHP